MSKTKINISLIKEGIPLGEIIKESTPKMQLANGHILYYKARPAAGPKWVETFFVDGITDTKEFKTKSISAVILYEIEVKPNLKRIFAICFGYGKSLIKPNIIEERFGLITTLNLVDFNCLRSIDVNSFESVPLKNRMQATKLSDPQHFNIDIDKNLLNSVTGKSSIASFSGTLSGSDSLSISTDRSYDNIENLLKECFNKYESTSYKEHFDWIDKMKAIKDTTKIESLDNMMIDEINKEEVSCVWMSIPEIIDWNRTDSFKFNSDKHYDDIDIQILKAEHNGAISIKNLKYKKLSSVNEDGTTIKQWPLYKCLYAEIKNNSKQFIFNEGKWFELSDDFVQEVNNYYNDFTISDIILRDYDVREEEKFNEQLAKEYPEEYCLMDKKLIAFGGNTIEFCDIYTKQKQFVHVKKYTSSAVLSHLFFQGFVSAESFLDPDFRKLVDEKLKEGFKISSCDKINANDYEVVFVIAQKDIVMNVRPNIPFFSKVAFRSVCKRLHKYGYNVSITGVPYTYVAKNNDEQTQ